MYRTLLTRLGVSIILSLSTSFGANATTEPKVQDIVSDRRLVEDCTKIQILTCDLNKGFRYGIQDTTLVVSIQYPYPLPQDMSSLYTLRLLGTIDGVDYILDEFSFEEVFSTTSAYEVLVDLNNYTTSSQTIPLWIEMVSKDKDANNQAFAQSVIPFHSIDYTVTTAQLEAVPDDTTPPTKEFKESKVSQLDLWSDILLVLLLVSLAYLAYKVFFEHLDDEEKEVVKSVPDLDIETVLTEPIQGVEEDTQEKDTISVEDILTTVFAKPIEPNNSDDEILDVEFEEIGEKVKLPQNYIEPSMTAEYAIIGEFLSYITESHNLSIKDYFDQIYYRQSFFLVAATGLGKTVALPVKVLQLMTSECVGRVWVVVPKIPIAIAEMEHLEHVYKQFKKHYQAQHPATTIPKTLTKMFGYRTGVGTKSPLAPIQFITTGVLPLIANSGELNPSIDCVIIDEAHETLEADQAIELSLVSLWKQSITVNYMSATVDTTDLEEKLHTKIIRADKSRFVNFYHNTGKPMLESIEDIVTKTLCEYDTTSQYFPPMDLWQDHNLYHIVIRGTNPEILTSTGISRRPTGMLIVVNSQKGEYSEAAELRKVIEPLCNEYNILILEFSGSIQRNKKMIEAFEHSMTQIEKNAQKFVIISTNVVEMGITWTYLDYVVTMDSELDNIMVNGQLFATKVPLGTNSLKQRGGRVGRKRAGCVYITKEFGTTYTELDDYQLNNQGLIPQPICFPLSTQEPYKLACSLASLGINNYEEVKKYLQFSSLPSLYKNHNLEYLATMTVELLSKYQVLGVGDPQNQTALTLSQRWVGDPLFPFVFEAFKCLTNKQDDQDYINFVILIYLGVVSQFAITDIYVKPNTVARIEGEKVIVNNVVDGYKNNLDDPTPTQVATNSDLLRLGLVETVEFCEIGYTQKRLGYYQYGGGNWKPEVIEYEKNRGVKPSNHLKFCELTISTFLEVIKVVEKHQELIDDEYFFENIVIMLKNGRNPEDYEDEHFLYKYVFDVSCAINFRAWTNWSEHRKMNHVNFLSKLTRIYQSVGFKFTLTSTNEPGVYQYTGIHQDTELRGVIDQRNHYCQLNTHSTFYGLLRPRSNRETGEIVFDLIHILRADTDYMKGI
jgi:DEAD/DEAH box helicase/Helicase conserved C-terminal domain